MLMLLLIIVSELCVYDTMYFLIHPHYHPLLIFSHKEMISNISALKYLKMAFLICFCRVVYLNYTAVMVVHQ